MFGLMKKDNIICIMVTIVNAVVQVQNMLEKIILFIFNQWTMNIATVIQ